MKQLLLYVFIGVSIVSGFTIFYLNRDGALSGKVTVSAKAFMDDVSITQKKEGAVSFMVNARKAVFINNADVRLTDLTMVFPERNLTLTSGSGLYNIKDKSLKIEGATQASTGSYVINASALTWDPAKNELTSPEKVIIEGERFELQGQGLEAKDNRAKLLGNVKAVFHGE